MAKMTKAQAKRLLQAIDSKAKKLWAPNKDYTFMTTQDMIAIEKIIKKNLKRLN
tara:strand:+ start:76 stop:237 length:162 start_codon:yes stop_codon:yes gene_type:complete